MGIDEDINEALAQMREFTAELQAQNQRDREAFDRRDRTADEQAAEARRRGESGPAWQRIQQRIDLRQTTLEDVMGGIDQSPEARQVRATLSQELGRVDRSTLVDDEELQEQIAVTQQAQAAMMRALDEARHAGEQF
ncbi:hypothetical protein [Cellulomonas denverensis]|uniref:Uncharacterized protein n=1 Tax=Cellulomonas denverensis TaxID=264297 RepID=A0A7X6QXP5_9CELL|nr:hypothetical protein [Cellulomonas denverensis]NKY21367.1 hypothetical protein [Cellulomonas denverensis]GIG27310.1 hypothetical protein Cde04nite_35540 [Cellulomonas denverensis]